MIRPAVALILLLTPLLLWGCMAAGFSPAVARKDPAPPPAFQFAPAQKAPAGPQEWWKTWGDQELNGLVEAALKGNPDLKQAAAQVLAARAQYDSSGASLYPSLALEGQGQYTRSSTALRSQSSLRDRTSETYNLSLAASYELDVWSRIRHGRRAAGADLVQAEENRRVAAQSVAAQVVTKYLQARTLERRLLVSERSIKAFTQSLEMVEGRYQRGLTSILEARQARRALAQARAERPDLIRELGQILQETALLAGRYPRTRDLNDPPREYVLDPGPVPVGLPSDLLRRRPDIRAAEANLQALGERIGQARAARFPVISLTGSLGFTSSELEDLLTDEANKGVLAFGLSAPLFDGGARSAAQRAAEANYRRGQAAYTGTVLNAFGEVEAALLTAREKIESKRLLTLALKEAQETQKEALSRYQRGLTDYLDVIDAQKIRYQIEETLVLTDLAIWTNRVTLHRALGGGWTQAD